MLDTTTPRLDYTDLQYGVHDPNIGCAGSHGRYFACSHWDLVSSQCQVQLTQSGLHQFTMCAHDPNTGPMVGITLGVGEFNIYAGYYQPKYGLQRFTILCA